MQKSSSPFEERLTELTAEFHRAVPARLTEIVAITARAASGSVPAIEELKLHLHRLAGSAATFGLPELSFSARLAEECIERDLARVPPILSDESRTHLIALDDYTIE